MSEYTYEDIIMDPEDPRLVGAIDKECYFSDYPKKVLNNARNDSSKYLSCLTNINKESVFPFASKNGSGWTLIIIKKEEPKPEPKYVPFKDTKEFIKAYQSAPGCLNEEDYYLSKHGLWLKEKGNGSDSEVYLMVNEIQNDGVFIGHADVDLGFANAYTKFTSWSKLYQRCNFLDGSPCGRLEEVK